MLKGLYKSFVGRLLRGGLVEVNDRLARIEAVACADRSSHAVWRGDLRTGCAVGLGGEPVLHATNRLRAELAYWVRTNDDPSSVLEDVADLAGTVQGWHAMRLATLAAAMGLGREELDSWAAARSAIELGGGPWPLIGSLSWKCAASIDPLSEGYEREGLGDLEAKFIRIAATAEAAPIPAGWADMVVCENALDHVTEPSLLLESARRMVASVGNLWLRVDLAQQTDDLHLHALTESVVEDLLDQSGWRILWQRVEAAKSRPDAEREFVALCGTR
ncbi:MAG: methyltransferase domain-containing protein [Planctomycetota bacterium]